jgi:hypothetical protein
LKNLKISQSLSLPVDVVTQAIGILAKRRAGKSYLARRIVEQLFATGQQVVIVDPKGDWWGARSSADGKSPGLPIVIFGGERGDVPLEAAAGALVAKLVVEKAVSALLDLSLLRKHEVATFMTGFLEELYRLKAREQYRTPLMVVVDEADAIAPQKPQPNQLRMLGAMDDLVRRGGQRGIGCCMVTQRSAVLSKDVLTQVQILITLRTIAPQDLAAIKAWIDVHGDAEGQRTLMASLPSLPIGDAWFWSPGWPTDAGIFQRAHVLPIETYDSGATPKPGQKRSEPKRLAQVELDAVRAEMAEIIERAKADDPKALRAEIATLKKQLGQGTKAQIAVPAAVDRVEVEVFDEKRFGEIFEAVSKHVDNVVACASNAKSDIGRLLGGYRNECREKRGNPLIVARAAAPKQLKAAPAQRAHVVGREPDPALGNSGLRRILIVLAQRAEGATDSQIAILTGISRTGGTFRTYVGRGKTLGWIDGGGARRTITEAGVKALGSYEPLPTGPDLLAYWLRELGTSGASRMLSAVAEAYDGLTREQLSEATEIELTGGTFRTYLGKLKTLELVTESGGVLALSEELR